MATGTRRLFEKKTFAVDKIHAHIDPLSGGYYMGGGILNEISAESYPRATAMYKLSNTTIAVDQK